jgi:hypothetical protein
MGITDRVNQATQQIQTQAQSKEPATARHTIYWKPTDLDALREFSGQHFVGMAEVVRAAVKFALDHEDEFLETLRAEHIKKLDGQTQSR